MRAFNSEVSKLSLCLTKDHAMKTNLCSTQYTKNILCTYVSGEGKIFLYSLVIRQTEVTSSYYRIQFKEQRNISKNFLRHSPSENSTLNFLSATL
jgi:hypothetical protein